MSFENLTAELTLLVDEIEGDQGDRHEIYLRIREKLGDPKAMGMPLPEDLVRLRGTSQPSWMRIWATPCNSRSTECYLFNAAGLVHLHISFGKAL